jgi:hypothetical protein
MQVAPQETTVSIASQDIETYFKAYIESALQQSRAQDCSPQQAMELIDRAWEVQKLLWQMRRAEAFSAAESQISQD